LLGYILDNSWDGRMIDGARLYSAEGYQTAFTALMIAYGVGFLACLFLVRETRCRQLVED